jgi:hypothetical protein
MSEETKRQDEARSDKERMEEITQFLRQEYGGKRLPHAGNELRVGSHAPGDGVPLVTLDTGIWNGQITVVGVRFHNGQYELRDYENRLRTAMRQRQAAKGRKPSSAASGSVTGGRPEVARLRHGKQALRPS